jgi:hypothetical protein
MAFKMGNEARLWFQKLETGNPVFQTMFDKYYLCLLLGLKVRSQSEVNGDDFIDTFPKEYESSRFSILGVIISAEMKRQGLDFSDAGPLKRLVTKIIDPVSQSRLTSEGFNVANRYAAGGFEELRARVGAESYPDKANLLMIRFGRDIL